MRKVTVLEVSGLKLKGAASLPVQRKISNTQYYNKQQAFEIIDSYLENRYKGSTGRPRTREQESF